MLNNGNEAFSSDIINYYNNKVKMISQKNSIFSQEQKVKSSKLVNFKLKVLIKIKLNNLNFFNDLKLFKFENKL